jgi:C-terminal processing protease CtpA/Prc
MVDAKLLQDGLGLVLEKKGDWVRIKSADPKKMAVSSGLKRGDRLISIDGQSLRYLNVEVVTQNLLFPRYSNFALEFERDCFVVKGEEDLKSIKELGFSLKLVYDGLKIGHVEPGSAASAVGLKDGDFVAGVNGLATRYTPLKKVEQLILETSGEKVALTVRRTALLARK